MLAAQMERPPTPKLSLAGAGSVLIGTTAAVIVIGIGSAGSPARPPGAFSSARSSGIPIGVFMTYKRYGHAL